VRKADNLPPSCAHVKKSGGLNLLEPCGPVQACNGTALLLPFTLRNNALHDLTLITSYLSFRGYRGFINWIF
jgi:hypothetical protein